MKKYSFILLVIFLLALSFLAGYWVNHESAEKKGGSGNRKILYYIDPMHPAYKSDKPGIAPDCGMKLEPVYEDGSAAKIGEDDASSLPPGTVNISPRKQQLIGVRVETVKRAPATRAVRLLGRVVPDEMKVYRVIAGSDGWIMNVAPVTTGSMVRADELLATFYSFELMTGIQAYVNSVETLDRFGRGNRDASKQARFAAGNSENYRNSLRNLGMSEHQLQEIDQTRRAPDEIEIRAPGPGLVITRNVSNEQRFQKGAELYQIADLSKVWVLADLFGTEAQTVKPGLAVKVTLPDQGRTFQGRVSQVKPVFDPATRTLKVRIEVDNPEYVLRPDMFVDVGFPVQVPPALAVPVDALLDSGIRKAVFVDKGNGYFEPRKVETGWRFGDRIEITKGLMPGERIVVSGTFLIDSESRMKAAAAGIYGESSKDPVCGMYVDEGKAKASGKTSEYQGKTYYFCSDGCKQQFDKGPGHYIGKSHGKNGLHRKPDSENMQALSAARVHKDPICGMDVDEKSARAAGRTSEYQGKTYYFCSDGCKQQFDKEPERYIEKKAGKAQNAEHPTTSAPIHN